MTQEPLVSVIVPAWNAERTLRATLESAAAQTYRNLEILVIDDGSADTTAAIAEEFCGSVPRAVLIRKKNGGVASARNRGIAAAQGDWIAPLDSDDLWHPSKIRKQVEVALAAPRTPGFVYCWYRIVDGQNRVLGSGPSVSFAGDAFNRLTYFNPVENGSALLIRRDAAVEAGGYDESLRAAHAQGCEDVMMQLRVALRHPIACVPEYLVAWRSHDRNMSCDVDQIVRSAELVYRRLRQEGVSVPPNAQRWLAARNGFHIATQRAASGNLAGAFAQIAKSILLDPLRSGLELTCRLLRSFRRRIGRDSLATPIKFADVDPSEIPPGDPFENSALRHALETIDRCRLMRLSQMDAEAGSAGGKLLRKTTGIDVADGQSGKRKQA